MPLGSSSEAPVMKPGPRILTARFSGLGSREMSSATPPDAAGGARWGILWRPGRRALIGRTNARQVPTAESRRVPGKETIAMGASRLLFAAVAIAGVLAVALIVGFRLDQHQQGV